MKIYIENAKQLNKLKNTNNKIYVESTMFNGYFMFVDKTLCSFDFSGKIKTYNTYIYFGDLPYYTKKKRWFEFWKK